MSVGRRLWRVGTAGRVPRTTWAWRRLCWSTLRGLRGMRPFTKSSDETLVMDWRTRGLLSAVWTFETYARLPLFRTRAPFLMLVILVTFVMFVMFTAL